MKKLSGWSIFGIIFFGLILVTGVWAVVSYNNLVNLHENVQSQYSNMDVYLQRRADLIPNLVNTVKGYTSHESQILEEIAKSREKLAGSSNISEKAEANNELSSAINRLLIVVENYPNLKADTQFTALCDELSGTENRIAVARKDYNLAVQNYNKSIKKFPMILIANILGFSSAERFEAAESSKEALTVNFN